MPNQYKNKVVYGNTTLIDITDTTAVAADVAQGKKFYAADGSPQIGTASGGSVLIVDTEDSHGGIIREITTGAGTVAIQGGKTITPAKVHETVLPDAGYDAFASVNVTTDIAKWVRPDDWPDIDAIVPWEDRENFEGCYFTYDNTGHNFTIASFYCTTDGGQYVVDRGHVEDGEFVSDTTANVNSDAKYFDNYAECGYTYPVYFVRPATEGKHITACGHCNLEASTYDLRVGVYGTDSPCIERAGHFPYVTSIGGAGSDKLLNTRYLVRDHLVWGDKSVVTSLAATWSYMNSLKEIDFTYWDTSDWEVTRMDTTWNACLSLLALDLTGWDVSGWAVTTMSYCFYNLASLKILDLTGWDTSNFNLQSFQNVFYSMPNAVVIKISALASSSTTISYPSTLVQLEDYYPMTLYGNQNYISGNVPFLRITHESLLRLLNSLPVGNYTLTLGKTVINKLTAEEIAIATNKGWTVA